MKKQQVAQVAKIEAKNVVEKVEEKSAKLMVVSNFEQLEKNALYSIVNNFDKKPKRSNAIFCQLFTDSRNNVCALFCVDENIFAIEKNDLLLAVPVKIRDKVQPIFSAEKVRKHFKKFNAMFSCNPRPETVAQYPIQ
jgi:hypothetical protein